MSWIEAAEAAMQSLSNTLSIPYDFERNESSTEQLPDTYMVYFLVDDPGRTWTDGKETSHEPRVQVSLFYRKKPIALAIPDQIEAAFMAVGFLRVNSSTIPYQPDTRHYGWRCDFRFYERR